MYQPPRMGRAWLLPTMLLIAACGSSSPESESEPKLGPQGCTFGDKTLDDGSCRPAGVPADRCGQGFVAESGACSAVLPATPCPPGWMALPGETSCREVAPCGDQTWGNIPVDATTEHVDGNYVGQFSDGTQKRRGPASRTQSTTLLPAR